MAVKHRGTMNDFTEIDQLGKIAYSSTSKLRGGFISIAERVKTTQITNYVEGL